MRLCVEMSHLEEVRIHYWISTDVYEDPIAGVGPPYPLSHRRFRVERWVAVSPHSEVDFNFGLVDLTRLVFFGGLRLHFVHYILLLSSLPSCVFFSYLGR